MCCFESRLRGYFHLVPSIESILDLMSKIGKIYIAPLNEKEGKGKSEEKRFFSFKSTKGESVGFSD